MSRWTDKRTAVQTDGQTDRRRDKQPNKQMDMCINNDTMFCVKNLELILKS